MKPRHIGLGIGVWAVAFSPLAWAAEGLSVLPKWQRNPTPRFSLHDGALWADGAPMPIIYEFTWSAPQDEELYRYHAQFLGNSHWHPIRCTLVREPHFNAEYIDDQYAKAAKHRIFMTLSPGVQSLSDYAKGHPDVRMLDNKGKPRRGNTGCFMHEGWRSVVTATMTSLARHVAGKPYNLGYYPQDEYSYRCFGGYQTASVLAFRKWLVNKHGSLEAVNTAWGKAFKSVDEIEPPRAFEKSVAFADWQEFRRWAQIDYTRVIYEALHKGDPNGMVIWSLPFWGSWRGAASWWDFEPYTDIFMRHGIGYRTGIYRLQMLRALSEWSGKPANALCMPPNHNPTYVQMGFMLDGPRSGLSHVCVGGSEVHTYYMGAADSDNNWKRREPMYTKSRALNDLVRYLGPTYLLSKRKQPAVGIFVSDRTVLLNGTNCSSLNGILNLLSDLNIEVQIFSEKTFGDLSRFKVVFAGTYARCINEELSQRFRTFVDKGGHVILTRGAFAADWFNRDVGEPGFGWATLVGEPAQGKAKSITTMPAALPANSPSQLPAAGAVSPRKPSAATVLATTDRGQPVIVRNGNVLYFGVDPGVVYTAGYTDDFAGVKKITDQGILDEFAGFSFDHEIAGADAAKFGAHKAYAQLMRVLLDDMGVRPELDISGPGKAIGALRARALHYKHDALVCLANRVVNPGKDHKDTPAREYHRVHHDLDIALAVQGKAAYAVQLPFADVAGERVDSLPQSLPVTVADGVARIKLPELVDVAAVLLTPDHAPLLGVGLDRRAATATERVAVRGRAVNPSPHEVSGIVYIDAATPLQASGKKLPIKLAPGATVEFQDVVAVPADAQPGYALVQWVGEFGGEPITSTSLEIEVLEDVRMKIVQPRLTRFPIEDKGSVVQAAATANLPAPLPITMAVEAPNGYRAEPATQTIDCSRGKPLTLRCTISATTDAPPPVSEAVVRLSATVRGREHVCERKIRLAHGAVTYREPKAVRFSAAPESKRVTRLVVLENPKLKATFIESTGVMHELILRHTGSDHFGEGDYPYGFVWYGGPGGWKLKSLSPPGDVLRATFACRENTPHPITLAVSLGKDDDFVKLQYDTHGMTKPVGSFYLMSRVSRTGEHDVMYVPLKKGLRTLPWTGRGVITPTRDELAERWLAVHSTAKDEVLGVVYDIPSMQKVLCRPRQSNHNYWVFRLNPAPPGTMTFWISAQKGGYERVRELCRKLLR